MGGIVVIFGEASVTGRGYPIVLKPPIRHVRAPGVEEHRTGAGLCGRNGEAGREAQRG